MDLVPFVAGPGIGKVDAELRSPADNGGLVHRDEGAQEFDPGVGPLADRTGHRFQKFLAAVGIDGVIPGMGRDHDPPGAATLGKAGRDR